MATPQEIQAAADAANTMQVFRITQSISIDATYDAHYVVGNVGVSSISTSHAGRSMWCRTAKADNATTQAVQIANALVAGPVDANTL